MFPDDPYFERMWGLHNENLPREYWDPMSVEDQQLRPRNDADIDMPEAWSMFTGSRDVIVAVTDTGCYIDHPDLAANIWVNEAELYGEPDVDDDGNGYIDDVHGWDFLHECPTVYNQADGDGHGTHVAGTIGACSNNGIGVTGVNWDVRIMPLKFLGPAGGSAYDSIRAVEYAARNGASVINASWGAPMPAPRALCDAIEASCILFVAAAGNARKNNDVWGYNPCNIRLENIISVAASAMDDWPCNYDLWGTNYGRNNVDLFAPGGYILSTLPPVSLVPGEEPKPVYGFNWGTSMATPHVTGVAALLIGKYPHIPLYQGAPGWTGGTTIRDIILDTVDKKPAFDGLCVTGGRLNAARALAAGEAPVITRAEADTHQGEPPLEVRFAAAAISGQQITDVWWDFGDGSAPVHEYETTHIYTQLGRYEAVFHVVDAVGVEATAAVQIRVSIEPKIGVSPTSLEPKSLTWGDTGTAQFHITNTGIANLDYTVGFEFAGFDPSGDGAPDSLPFVVSSDGIGLLNGDVSALRTGGPDKHGYVWADSRQPGGPAFEWNDIREIGTRVDMAYRWPEPATMDATVDLPFEFPFYGEMKNQVRISMYGYLTFGSHCPGGVGHIPNPAEPNDVIAASARGISGGTVYYYGDDQVFIVQWTDMRGWTYLGPYTFQAILTREGDITYQYLSMTDWSWGTEYGECSSGVIGIENSDGTDGLEVAYNIPWYFPPAQYLPPGHDKYAVIFVPAWIAASPTEGTVAPGGSQTIDVTFLSNKLARGDWRANLVVRSNDEDTPEVRVETLTRVKSVIPPVVTLEADPMLGSAPLVVHFTATTYDRDGEIADYVWNFGDGSDPLRGTLTPVHAYTRDGEYNATLKATDNEGLTTTKTVHIVVRPVPKAEVAPPEIDVIMSPGASRTETITISNKGAAELSFAITTFDDASFKPAGVEGMSAQGDLEQPAGEFEPLRKGGPDLFGYYFVDSDEPDGPAFDWVEIKDIGTKMEKHSMFVEVDLPWEFPFYGQSKDRLTIYRWGVLSFEPGQDRKAPPYTPPDTFFPNDMLAVWWDNCMEEPGGSDHGGWICYHHDQANDRFMVEYYRVANATDCYTFQVILYPDGRITYQYLDMVFTADDWRQGTIGIEDAAGRVGLCVKPRREFGYIHNNLAIEFRKASWLSVGAKSGTVPPGGSVDVEAKIDLSMFTNKNSFNGLVVIDTNDVLRPEIVVPVRVKADTAPNEPPVITACGVNPQRGPVETEFEFVASANDPDGTIADKYWDFGDGAPLVHEFVAKHKYSKEGVYTAKFTVVDDKGAKASAEAAVRVGQLPSASWSPGQLYCRLPARTTGTATLTLSNAGPGTLRFGPQELGIAAAELERLIAPEAIADYGALTTEGIFKPNASPERSPWLPESAGRIIRKWEVPTPWGDPFHNYGVAVNFNTRNLIMNKWGFGAPNFFVFTPDGRWTGEWWMNAGFYTFELAWDGARVWTVDGVDSSRIVRVIGQHAGGGVDAVLTGEWSAASQRGLTYNPKDDTFFVGGWVENIIYRIKGLSWDNPGEVIEKWPMQVGISGLAYHPGANVLVVASNAAPDMIYFVNPDTHTTLAQMPHPAGSKYGGAGIHFDVDGNLWVQSQTDISIYLIETGLGGLVISSTPSSGAVPAGGSVDIEVTVDATCLKGHWRGDMILFTDDPDSRVIAVPVNVDVAEPPEIAEVGAEPTSGDAPLDVRFFAGVRKTDSPIVHYGWDFGDGSSPVEALEARHTYTASGDYTAVFTVTDEAGGSSSQSVVVNVGTLPAATVDRTMVEVTLPWDGQTVESITLGNVKGHKALDFVAGVSRGAVESPSSSECVDGLLAPDLLTAQSMYIDAILPDVEGSGGMIEPDAAGSIIKQWRAPAPVKVVWGIGCDGQNVWISDGDSSAIYVVAPDGTYTGISYPITWLDGGLWVADMAYDKNRNYMWHVSVSEGGDNGIYALDCATGKIAMHIEAEGSWTAVSQRGLAYDPETDTFYIAGWNENMIYHFKGPSWDYPGEALEKWQGPSSGIAGLAYRPGGALWVACQDGARGDRIYAIDPATRSILRTIQHPSLGRGNMSCGLDMDADGNLWVGSFGNSTVYLIDTEMPIPKGVSVDPSSGTVAAGGSRRIDLHFEARDLGRPGQDVRSILELRTSDPHNPVLQVELVTHILGGPSISQVQVTPTVGEPPLEVTFAAIVTPGASPIADVWWGFGDGSEPVHSAQAVHVYTEPRMYVAAISAKDENGAVTTEKRRIKVDLLPTLVIDPPVLDRVIPAGTGRQESITISNDGNSPLSFSVYPRAAIPSQRHMAADGIGSPEVAGAAQEPVRDRFGYTWRDSDQPGGLVFDWMEINQIGAKLDHMYQGSTQLVQLPFEFPFYGSMKKWVGVSSSGYLFFQMGSPRAPQGASMPNPNPPNELIAAFWLNLDPSAPDAGIYYYHDEMEDRFIIQYDQAAVQVDIDDWYEPIYGPWRFTFQIILYPDGTILLQYLNMSGATGAPSGIENATGEDGLMIAHMEDELAVIISPLYSVMDVSPTSGYVLPGHSQDILVTLGTPQATPGTYSFDLCVTSNDPFRPSAVVPVTLKLNQAPRVEKTAPGGGDTWAGRQEIKWTATDPDDPADALSVDLYWSRDGGEWHEIAKGLANSGSYMWNTASVGLGGDAFRVRIVVTDPAGQSAEIISEPFTIINDAPTAAFSFSPSPATVTSVVEFVDESTDDGEIVAWHWEFGDGAESSEQNPKHQYSAKRKFTVNLTVTDNGELTGVCEKQVQVVNVAPTVRILRPEAGETWTRAREIEYEASDADGDPLTIRLEYDYLGDEAGWQLIADGRENAGKYLWDISKLAKGGRYRVRVAAADPDGGTAEAVSGEFTIIVLKHMAMAAPNPAKGSVTFYYDIESDAVIYVYDVAGRLVYSADLAAGTNAHEWSLTTSGRPVAAGLYLYVVVTCDGVKSEVGRLVIER